MQHPSVPEVLRAAGAATATTALAAALVTALPDHAAAALSPRATVDALVLAAVLGLAAVAATALAAGCVALALAMFARATGRRAVTLDRAARALTPAALRRLVAAGVGIGLGLGGAATATAVEADLGWQPTVAPAGTSAPATAATDRTADSPSRDAGATSTPRVVLDVAETPPNDAPGVEPRTVATVRPGDTLWGLAADHLGTDATDADVAAAWPRWHEVNRTVIGADPDVLRPGQVLVVPTGVVLTASATASEEETR